MRWIKWAFLLVVVALASCTAGGFHSPLPTEGRKMVNIYRGHGKRLVSDQRQPEQERLKLSVQRVLKLPPTPNTSRTRDGKPELKSPRFKVSYLEDDDHWGTGEDSVSVLSNAGDEFLLRDTTNELAEPSPSNSLYGDYMRQSTNEIEVLFPRLPNPDIQVFVYPHLATANNVPVPGYATVIPLYERVEYALPGESANYQQ